MTALTAVMWSCGLELDQWTNLVSDGVVVILVVCMSTPVQVLLLTLMARWVGANPADYLGHAAAQRIGIIAVVVFVLSVEGISWLLGRVIASQFQIDTYRTASAAGWLPWLLLTVVVVAVPGDVATRPTRHR